VTARPVISIVRETKSRGYLNGVGRTSLMGCLPVGRFLSLQLKLLVVPFKGDVMPITFFGGLAV